MEKVAEGLRHIERDAACCAVCGHAHDCPVELGDGTVIEHGWACDANDVQGNHPKSSATFAALCRVPEAWS